MEHKHLISLADLLSEEHFKILELARNLKLAHRAGVRHDMLAGKTLTMVFQKPSLRTKVSLETGTWQWGGYAIYLGPSDIKLGQRETTEDIALNLSRFVDGIMARVFEHRTIPEAGLAFDQSRHQRALRDPGDVPTGRRGCGL